MTEPEHPVSFVDVPVDVEAAFAGPVMRVSELLALRVGSVVATPRCVGENIAVFAGGARIGAGELSSRSRRTVIRMVRFGSEI
jgi:flagellar motor switch/type III secretory pathway protein FliN